MGLGDSLRTENTLWQAPPARLRRTGPALGVHGILHPHMRHDVALTLDDPSGGARPGSRELPRDLPDRLCPGACKPGAAARGAGRSRSRREVQRVTRAEKAIVAVIAAVFATVLIPALFSYFNRIEPVVLGMPFVIFWLAVVNLVGSLGLTLAWYLRRREG